MLQCVALLFNSILSAVTSYAVFTADKPYPAVFGWIIGIWMMLSIVGFASWLKDDFDSY